MQYTEEEVRLASVCAQLRHIDEAATDLVNWADYASSVNFDSEDGVTAMGFVFPPGVSYSQCLQRPSSTAAAYISEGHYRMLRARSRAFCISNPYWMAVRENKISYAVGTGHVISILPRRKGKKVPDDLQWKVQDEIEKFTKANHYRTLQGEKLTRLDRDGEFFLQYGTDTIDWHGEEQTVLAVDFIEPLLVQDPPGMGPQTNTWFGVQYGGNRYSRPLGYYIKHAMYDGTMNADMDRLWREMIPASEIQHRKANVDLSSPRGLPTTYGLQDTLTQAMSTLKSMGKLVDIRARIALIRKQVNATLGQIQPLLLKNRSGQAAKGGLVRNAFSIPYGGIIDTNDQRSYEMPAQRIETDKIVHSLKADLQSIAAAVGLADFTLSGDSSSAFSNSLVKEGPMDRAIGRIQQDLIEDDGEVYERALLVAAENDRLPEDILETIQIEITPPGVIARERLTTTQADEILWRCGAMSTATMAMHANLDPEDEKAKGAKPQLKGQGSGDTRSHQPSLKGGKPGRGVPVGKEPGPGVNPRRAEEGLDESSHEPHAKELPTQAELNMASTLLTDQWCIQTKAEILGLPNTGTAIQNTGVRVPYEDGLDAVLLGVVDGQRVLGVDAAAVMLKHDAHGFVCCANHERFPWVSVDVILVDWALPVGAILPTLWHDVVETRLMSVGKWPYSMAHNVARYYEIQWLREIRPDLAGLAP